MNRIETRETNDLRKSILAAVALVVIVLGLCWSVQAQAVQCQVIIPIATTVNGFDSGITIINVAEEDLQITQISYKDAKDPLLDKTFAFSERVRAGRRWSILLSEIPDLGRGRDGYVTVNYFKVKKGPYIYMALIDPTGTTSVIPAADLTCITLRD